MVRRPSPTVLSMSTSPNCSFSCDGLSRLLVASDPASVRMAGGRRTRSPTRASAVRQSRALGSCHLRMIANLHSSGRRGNQRRRTRADSRAHERSATWRISLTDLTLSRETHPDAPRLSGAPLAATKPWVAGAICKRRDAVTLGMREAARLPGLATSVSAASA